MSKTSFRSESAETKCRVCCKTLLQKNYKDHIKTKHPQEDHTDTTPFGQKKLTTSFFKKVETSKKRCSASGSDLQESSSDILPKRIHIDEGETCDSPIPVDQEFQTPLYSTKDIEDESVDWDTGCPGGTGEKTKLDMILEKLSNIPASTNDNIVLTKLDKIQGQLTELQSQNEMRVEKSNKQPNKSSSSATNDTYADYTDDIKRIKTIRSLKELVDLGFTYDSNTSELACVVCHQSCDSNNANSGTEKATGPTDGVFTYPYDLDQNFDDHEYLPRAFINLKKSVKRHLIDSISHQKNVKAEEERKAKQSLLEKKNENAGMNLGRLCMKLYLKGRPYSDYEDDVLVQKMNGAVVGELNHSRKFPAAFRPFVSKTIVRRVSEFIGRKLPQTGHLPAVNITADKATYKHNTRQFLSCVTVMPHAEELLQVISFGQPIVKGHTGIELARNIKEGMDKFNIKSCQIEGGSFDGQYFHLGVQKALESPTVYDLPPNSVFWAWDALHKSGLVDTHLCKEERFQWLVDDTEVCSQLFRMFNWGKNHEKLVEASVLWKLHLKELVKFSETRFANSRRQVYINIHHDLPAIITCLEEKILLSHQNPTDGKLREKASEAKELKGKLLNVRFLLTLAGCADIYDQYGKIVNVTQIVNLLPHERLELFTKEVNVLQAMVKCLTDHENCGKFVDEKAKVKCLFPIFHDDKESLSTKGEIRNVPVLDQNAVVAADLLSRTRNMRRQATILQSVNAEKQVEERLSMLVSTLYSGLKDEVFDEQAVRGLTIDHTKTVLNLPDIACS